MKAALEALGALLLAAVLGTALTFLLWPLWSWVEAVFGIESLGHSGPAAWCFVGVTALLWSVWLGWRWRKRR
jgi:predicted PurR-regulated permease PerM